MRKRWFISLIIGIIITGGCLGYLQFGRDMDVYGSHAMTADNYHEERLTGISPVWKRYGCVWFPCNDSGQLP